MCCHVVCVVMWCVVCLPACLPACLPDLHDIHPPAASAQGFLPDMRFFLWMVPCLARTASKPMALGGGASRLERGEIGDEAEQEESLGKQRAVRLVVHSLPLVLLDHGALPARRCDGVHPRLRFGQQGVRPSHVLLWHADLERQELVLQREPGRQPLGNCLILRVEPPQLLEHVLDAELGRSSRVVPAPRRGKRSEREGTARRSK